MAEETVNSLSEEQLQLLESFKNPVPNENEEDENKDTEGDIPESSWNMLQEFKNRAAQDANPNYMVNPSEDITMETTIEDVRAKYPGNIPLQQIVASDAYQNATTEKERQR
jgi:hypothetical protein